MVQETHRQVYEVEDLRIQRGKLGRSWGYTPHFSDHPHPPGSALSQSPKPRDTLFFSMLPGQVY